MSKESPRKRARKESHTLFNYFASQSRSGSHSPTKPISKREDRDKGKRKEVIVLDEDDAIDSDKVPSSLTDEEFAKALHRQLNGDVTIAVSDGSSKIEPNDQEFARRVDVEPNYGMEGFDSTRSQNKIIISVESKRVKDEVLAVSKRDLEESASGTPSGINSPRKSEKKRKFQAEDDYAPSLDSNEFPLSIDPFIFDPSNLPLSKEDPLPYSLLSASFILLSGTKSRLLITSILTNLIRTIMFFSPSLLLPSLYLIMGQGMGSAWEKPGEYGVGGKILATLIGDLAGCTKAKLKSLWNISGDPGDVAYQAISKSRPSTLKGFGVREKPLTIEFVYDTLMQLPTLKGQNSQKLKMEKLRKLLLRARGEEIRWVVRTLASNLRVGAVKLTVLNSLARAACLVPLGGSEQGDEFYISPDRRLGILMVLPKGGKKVKSTAARDDMIKLLDRAESILREVYVRHPSYSYILPKLLRYGLARLPQHVNVTPGCPVLFMLGQITRNLREVEERLGRRRLFAAEWKYDGQRVQIHARLKGHDEQPVFEGGVLVGDQRKVHVRLFSRHLEDMTDKYPDIVALIPHLVDRLTNVNTTEISFIIDAEICAIDNSTNELLPFQTLATRGRKDVRVEDVKVRVGIFAFDLMFLNGEALLHSPFRERRQLLHAMFPLFESENIGIARFDHVRSLESSMEKADEVEVFMKMAIENRCEGIMVKILDERPVDGILPEVDENDTDKKGRRKPLPAGYECDKRAESWLKVKKDYGSTGDTFDLVPIGGFHGMGRKNAWYSPILLAIYDPTNETFVAVCKCMSGFSDAVYKEIFDRYTVDDEMASKDFIFSEIESPIRPDVYFKPREVWEIQAADLTLSPVYKAGIGEVSESRGISLRFPRFLRRREDKKIFDAMSAEELGEAYRRQAQAQKPIDMEEE